MPCAWSVYFRYEFRFHCEVRVKHCPFHFIFGPSVQTENQLMWCRNLKCQQFHTLKWFEWLANTQIVSSAVCGVRFSNDIENTIMFRIQHRMGRVSRLLIHDSHDYNIYTVSFYVVHIYLQYSCVTWDNYMLYIAKPHSFFAISLQSNRFLRILRIYFRCIFLFSFFIEIWVTFVFFVRMNCGFVLFLQALNFPASNNFQLNYKNAGW